MARPISAGAMKRIATGAHYVWSLTITHPDAEPVEVNIDRDFAPQERSVIAGPRLGVPRLQLRHTPGIRDLFEFAGVDDAIYRLRIGVVMGTTNEWWTVFTGRAVEGSSRRNNLGVVVSLADGWSWSDGVPFDAEFTTVEGTARATNIVEIMTSPGVDFGTEIFDVGGYITYPSVYNSSRGQAVLELATDGLVQVGFNADGDFVVKPQHDMDEPLTPDWWFKAGTDPLMTPHETQPANIVAETLERTRPWASSLFNGVVVKPGRTEQTWTQQWAELADENDPRHWTKRGWRPYTITSNTIDNACDAWKLARKMMLRIARTTAESIRFQVPLNPAIEADDIVSPAALPTFDDSGWSGDYIATSVTHSPALATTAIEAVTARGYSIV